uniref:Sugar phosphate transporter domain-containing protein n=1 Tax=Sexangularia sp. CB-2014 TaxID=1486929 RepID=A0A7S1V8E9_9EUKA
MGIPFSPGLIICAVGVYISYTLYGLFQEVIFATNWGSEANPAHFHYTLTMLTLQTAFNSLMALVCMVVLPESQESRNSLFSSTSTLLAYALASAAYIGAMIASNASLAHIDYPTQVLGKSCKPLALVIVALVTCRGVPRHKVASVSLITAGIVAFNLERVKAGSTAAPNADLTLGRMLIVASLAFDGISGLVQDGMVRRLQPTPYQMMAYNNGFSVLYLLIGVLLTGEGPASISFLTTHTAIWQPLAGFALCSAIGQIFIYHTVRSYGSLATSIVTTTRKFFTIIVSVMWFGHSLSTSQWTAVAVVFAGLMLHVYLGHAAKASAAKHPPKKDD